MQSLQHVNQQFALTDKLQFSQNAHGLIIAEITSAQASARISLSGAHLLSWQPADLDTPAIWLSEQANLIPGKSIRGGIPVCWPWFGPHPQDGTLPAHGFARTSQWQVTHSGIANDVITLGFELQSSDSNYPCSARLEYKIGPQLELTLTTHNHGSQALTISEAMHTYFHISDIADIQLQGLNNVAYWDKVSNHPATMTQQQAVQFSAETDRVYINSPQACTIHDPGLKRDIQINKTGSLSTVVWSPWYEKAERMGDLGANNGWRQMVCVESANAFDNTLILAPDQTHTLNVNYQVKKLDDF